MKSVAITSLFALSYVQANLVCPPGSEQVGQLGVDISGQGLESPDERYQDNYQSIFDCSRQCAFLDSCKSFSWSDAGGCHNHPTSSVCTLYDTDVPDCNVMEGDTKILCKPLSCPTGSSQIAGLNAAITDASKVINVIRVCASIEVCSNACSNTDGCVSYSWQPDNENQNNVCTLYSTIIPDEEGTKHQVLCKKECDLAFNNGCDAYAMGDPHFETFSCWKHHFMGPDPDCAEYPGHSFTYYYIKSCDTSDRYNMPFALSSTLAPATEAVGTYSYIWNLELYTGPLPNDNYYFFFRKRNNIYTYGRFNFQVSPVLSRIQNDAQLANKLEDFPASGIFKRSTNWGDYELSITTDVRTITDADGNPSEESWDIWTLKVTRDGHTCETVFENFYHRVDVTKMECYECFTCGLFGDYHTPNNGKQLVQCDGSVRDIDTDDQYNPDGWGWEVDYIKNDCQARWDVVNKPNYKLQCSTAIKREAVLQCQEARTNAAECCYHIGTNYCDQLQYDCEFDACVAGAGGSLANVQNIVHDEFTAPVTVECQNNQKFGPVPKYMWQFDGDYSETMTGGDPQFTLNPTGNVQIKRGRLSCDGNGGTAHTNTLTMNLLSHSFEVLFRLDNTHKGGSIMNLELPGTGVNNYGFAAVTFNQLQGNNNADRIGITTRSSASDKEYKVTNSAEQWKDYQMIHLVAVFDPNNNELTLYQDGVKKIKADNLNVKAFIKSANGDYQIEFCGGINLQNYKESFGGSISFGAFYDTALDASDAQNLYNMRVPSGFGVKFENIGDELLANDVMYKGQGLVSDDGSYAFVLTWQGDLVIIYKDGSTKWNIGTTEGEYFKYTERGIGLLMDANEESIEFVIKRNDDPGHLIMQSDGNLVAYAGRERNSYASVGANTGVSAGVDSWMPLDSGSIFDWVYPPKDTTSINIKNDPNMVYAVYAVIILLSINVFVMSMKCWRQCKLNEKHKYNKVSMVGTELDTDTDVEIQ